MRLEQYFPRGYWSGPNGEESITGGGVFNRLSDLDREFTDWGRKEETDETA